MKEAKKYELSKGMYVLGLVGLISFITFIGVYVSHNQYADWQFWSKVELAPFGWKIWIGLFQISIILTNVFILLLGINKILNMEEN